MSARSYPNTFFVAEMFYVLSEKCLTGGSVAIATLTSGRYFAARNKAFMTERRY